MMAKKRQKNHVLSRKLNQDIERRKKEKEMKRTTITSEPDEDLFRGFGKLSLRDDPRVNTSLNTGQAVLSLNEIKRPKGLLNLGNTCYFNSVLQVLSQTPLLYEMLNSRSTETNWDAHHLDSLKEDIEKLNDSSLVNGANVNENGATADTKQTYTFSLVAPNALTNSMINFLRDMRSSNTAAGRPHNLLKSVGCKYSQFSGRDQQDSHELLRCLIDSIKTDEIRRQRKAILNGLNVNAQNTTNVDDDTKALIKNLGYASNFTMIDAIFGGYILSTVKCEECESVSQILEPFFDLCLPIGEEKPKHKAMMKRKSDNETTEEEHLIVKDHVNLSLKDRRSKRQQKKAAKREARAVRRLIGQETVIKDEIENPTPNVKVDVNVIVSAGKVDVNVSVENGDTVDCNVKVKMNDNEEVVDDSLEVTKSLENSMDESELDDPSIDENLSNVNEADGEEDEIVNKDESAKNEDSDKSSSEETEIKGLSKISEINNNQISWSLLPLNQKGKQLNSDELSLATCLTNFTSAELLAGSNKLCCETCSKRKGPDEKVYSNASKHTLIALPPPILTLQLKRFYAEGYRCANLKKINRFVSFPEVLDLSSFVSNISKPLNKLLNLELNSNQVIYSLYGVIEHSGSLRSGHYTAFVKLGTRCDRKFVRMKPFLPKVNDILKHVHFLADEKVNDDVEFNKNGDGKWFHVSDSHVASASLSSVLSAQAYILFYERIL